MTIETVSVEVVDTLPVIATEEMMEDFMRKHDLQLEDIEGCVDSTLVFDYACDTLHRVSYRLVGMGAYLETYVFIKES